MSTDKRCIAAACAVTTFIAAVMWLFNAGNQPFSVESLWWAAPLASPIAFLLYYNWIWAGAVAQTVLYALSIAGAYPFIKADCDRGNCVTHNKVAMVFGAGIAGYQIVGMLVILVGMYAGTVWAGRKRST